MTTFASRPVHESLQSASPLDTLVRTSSTRHNTHRGLPEPVSIVPLPPDDDQDISPRSRQGRPPSSPLLHTRFRTSTATHNTLNTSIDLLNRSHEYGRSPDHSLDDASVYANDDVTQRGSNMYGGPMDRLTYDDDIGNYSSGPRPRRSRDIDPFMSSHSQGANSGYPLPQVVVSTEPQEQSYANSPYPEPWRPSPTAHSAGRVPSLTSPSINYSRPNLRTLGSEDEKRRVLERNQQRRSPSTRSPQASQYNSNGHASTSTYSVASAPTPYIDTPPALARSRSEGNPGQSTLASAKPPPLAIGGQPYPPAPARRSDSRSNTPTSGQTVTFYGQPQANGSTPTSLYSAYSYYPYEEAIHSPVGNTLQVPGAPPPPMGRSQSSPNLSSGRSTPTSPLTSPASGGTSSDEYLQLGIQHHEADRLTESAACFEKSAMLAETEKGASGVGMLMWGLTLRHGWGCAKNEKKGFSWLRKAAEAAVGDLEKARKDIASSVIKGELVLAIYEVGQCFYQGWGVKKDQKMGVSYFRVAAELGDADAQQELAFCLANGRGCKKDRKEAAKWYRDAVKQGASDVGLAWIYKEKFQ